MSETKMSLRDTIIPKSDQLNYDDVASGPLTVRVTGLASGSPEQPVIVHVANDATGAALRDFKPCKTMRRVLIAGWGDKGKDWLDKRMTLYGDPTAKFGGVEVGGIRISHMSDIAADMTLLVTVSKGKRANYAVQALKGAE